MTYGNDSHIAEWYVDSCASIHITNDIKDLQDPQIHVETIGTGGGPTASTHIGVACVHEVKLDPVLLVPGFPRKLISVARIVNNGGSFSVGNGNKIVFQGKEL